MSMVIDGTNGLTFNNATTQNSGGKVLQVVNATYSTAVTVNNSTTYVDTGLTATITPLFSTSKILVLVNQSVGKDTANIGTEVQILRGATNIGQVARYAGFNGTTASIYGYSCSMTFLDSPATTSATIYKTQVASTAASGGNSQAQPNGASSSITLMEIAQ